MPRNISPLTKGTDFDGQRNETKSGEREGICRIFRRNRRPGKVQQTRTDPEGNDILRYMYLESARRDDHSDIRFLSSPERFLWLHMERTLDLNRMEKALDGGNNRRHNVLHVQF
jgi:hypothetical protein